MLISDFYFLATPEEQLDAVPENSDLTLSRSMFSTSLVAGLVSPEARASTVPMITRPYQLDNGDLVNTGNNAKYVRGLWEHQVCPGRKTITSTSPLEWTEKKPVAVLFRSPMNTKPEQEILRQVVNDISNQDNGIPFFLSLSDLLSK